MIATESFARAWSRLKGHPSVWALALIAAAARAGAEILLCFWLGRVASAWLSGGPLVPEGLWPVLLALALAKLLVEPAIDAALVRIADGGGSIRPRAIVLRVTAVLGQGGLLAILGAQVHAVPALGIDLLPKLLSGGLALLVIGVATEVLLAPAFTSIALGERLQVPHPLQALWLWLALAALDLLAWFAAFAFLPRESFELADPQAFLRLIPGLVSSQATGIALARALGAPVRALRWAAWVEFIRSAAPAPPRRSP